MLSNRQSWKQAAQPETLRARVQAHGQWEHPLEHRNPAIGHPTSEEQAVGLISGERDAHDALAEPGSELPRGRDLEPELRRCGLVAAHPSQALLARPGLRPPIQALARFAVLAPGWPWRRLATASPARPHLPRPAAPTLRTAWWRHRISRTPIATSHFHPPRIHLFLVSE